MRIFNFIEIIKGQYKVFNEYLRIAAEEFKVEYRLFDFDFYFHNQATSNLLLHIQKIKPDDVVLIPPYGKIIDLIREGFKPSGFVVLVDLKGPSGIDSAVMIANSIDNFAYTSPLIGDPQFEEGFKFLASKKVKIFPLPYFPSSQSIFNGNILSKFNRNYELKIPKSKVCYIGSVWGKRKDYLTSIALSIKSSKLVIKNNLQISKYIDTIESNLAGIDFAGAEVCTYRFIETVLIGRLCITEKRPFFVLGRPPKDKNEIFYFSNDKELVNIIKYVLASFSESIEIGYNGNKWYLNTQTPLNYLSYILSIAKGGKKEVSLPLTLEGKLIDCFWSAWDSN